MSESVLSLKNIRKDFISSAEKLTILNGLDLEVPKNSRIIITGESGSGKSTLLNIIGGLENPTAGKITAGTWQVENLDETSLTVFRRDYLGLVFQFHHLLKDFTALENVMLPAYMAGCSHREAMDRARSLLADVHLEHRLHHFPSQLSGGERQRAAVARALINNPELVLADEPTGNLDPANAALVRDVLFSVVTRHGKALVLVTHDHELAALGDSHYRLIGGTLELQ